MKSKLIIPMIIATELIQPVNSVRAQEISARLELSPFPIYPGDNSPNLDSVLAGKAVFYDIARREVVISYPDAHQAGVRTVIRFERRNQVEPVVSSAVSRRADGMYVYQYGVVNAQNAAKKLNVFAVSVAKDDARLTASHPTWPAASSSSDLTRPGSIRPEMTVVWTVTPGNELDRGAAAAGFEVVSQYRPGLVIGYAQASVDADLTSQILETLPQSVTAELAPAMSPRWNANQFMTIAPKFKDTDPKELVAADFRRSLTQLSVQGPLQKNSTFVSGALGLLDAILANPSAPTPNLDALNQTAPGLESEIAAALRISLE